MNKILLVYDGEEIVLITKTKVEDIVSFFNLNSDEQFVLLESIDGKIGLNPRLVTLIKDITKEKDVPSKNLECNVNIDAKKLAARIKGILREELSRI